MKRFILFILTILFLFTGFALAESDWTCLNCGAVGTENYCTVCGYPRPTDSAKTWICPNCLAAGTENYCTNCGRPKPTELWTCENCGKIGAEYFCTNCGRPRPADPAQLWTCPRCGMAAAENYCTNCGHPKPSEKQTESAAHEHDIAAATCEAVMYCRTCGEIFGPALGHDFVPATETMPMYCARCLKIVGEPLAKAPVSDPVQASAVKQEWNIGDTVTFGAYPQTEAGDDDTPIEWTVLETQDGRALLISRYALDAKAYNSGGKACSWENSALRAWLNDGFLNRAFTQEDKNKILPANVTADPNPICAAGQGSGVTDSVFLLSISEAEKYFANDKARLCAPTDYAVKNGACRNSTYTVNGIPVTWWWLRSSGFTGYYTAAVLGVGNIDSSGRDNSFDFMSVRPCIWIAADDTAPN